jgi:hypothetical protein
VIVSLAWHCELVPSLIFSLSLSPPPTLPLKQQTGTIFYHNCGTDMCQVLFNLIRNNCCYALECCKYTSKLTNLNKSHTAHFIFLCFLQIGRLECLTLMEFQLLICIRFPGTLSSMFHNLVKDVRRATL